MTETRTVIAGNNATMMAAFAAADLETLQELYTEDARFMLPSAPPAVGRNQIAAAFQGMLGSGLKGLNLRTDELVVNGETAVEVGSYTLTVEGGVEADNGTYMVLWQAAGDRWMIHRDIVCSSVQQTAA